MGEINVYCRGYIFGNLNNLGPSNKYDQQVMGTFFPINFQLFVGRDGGFVDNNGDGVSDQ